MASDRRGDGRSGISSGLPGTGILLPDGGGEQSAAADRTFLSRHAMDTASLHHRLAKAKFSSMGGELYAMLLESMLTIQFVSKMKIKLTDAGKSKYKEALEKMPLSNEQLWQRGSEISTRGRGTRPTYQDLLERLGHGWDIDKVKRFFNSRPNYPVTESEAKLICKCLGIEFDLSDYEIKQGTSMNYIPAFQETGSSGERFDEREGREDGDEVLEDEALDDQQPCNPVALRAEASDGSIPDPFASSDFHLKVRVEEPDSNSVLDQSPKGAASWTCMMHCSLYQGQSPIDLLFMITAGLPMDPFYFDVNEPGPLIDRVKRLLKVARSKCKRLHSESPNSLAPRRVHLHLMLPLTCLAGRLPATIQERLGAKMESLGRQVFFGCSDREELDESADTQLHSQSTKVNQKLYSGEALSSLKWATVCPEAVQPVAFDQFFQASENILHLQASSLDSEARHCNLVGRDALFTTDQSLLFVDELGSAGKGLGNADVCRRWKRLVEIGMPLVLCWRDGTESLSQNIERLGRVFGGSWNALCGHLDRLDKILDSSDELALEMRSFVAKLGIFYEEPLRCLPSRFPPLSSSASCE